MRCQTSLLCEVENVESYPQRHLLHVDVRSSSCCAGSGSSHPAELAWPAGDHTALAAEAARSR